jgi:hypothetical protein
MQKAFYRNYDNRFSCDISDFWKTVLAHLCLKLLGFFLAMRYYFYLKKITGENAAKPIISYINRCDQLLH